MISKLAIILTGAFGGMFPNLINLAAKLTNESAHMPEITFILGMVLFGSMGAAVALIWKEIDLKKVFYIGIGLPSLIQVSASNLSNPQLASASFPVDESAIAAFFIRPVFAEDQKPIPNRKIIINKSEDSVPYKIIFSSPDKGKQETITVTPEKEQTIAVPDYADTYTIQKNQSVSKQNTLPREEDGTVEIEVEIEKKSWSGLFEAFGVKNVNPYEIKVQQGPPEAKEK